MLYLSHYKLVKTRCRPNGTCSASRPPAVLHTTTTDASEQYNTGTLSGPVLTTNVNTNIFVQSKNRRITDKG